MRFAPETGVGYEVGAELDLPRPALVAIWVTTRDDVFGVMNCGWVLIWYVGLIVPSYLPTV